MAAGLTALMILLFLGNWRLTLIILASIPLSIITAILVMYVGGQTFNTMTLGGFALAVGILVDNGTVVIENIERHVRLGEALRRRSSTARAKSRVPTSLSTLCICIVFVPGVPAAGHGEISVFAVVALGLHFAARQPGAVVHAGAGAVLFPHALVGGGAPWPGTPAQARRRRGNVFVAFHHDFEARFSSFAKPIATVAWTASRRPLVTSLFFLLLIACPCLLFPRLGEDFFPQVDAGQMRLHVRAPPATRIEDTQHDFANVETRDPRDRRRRSDRRHSRQYRPALQRHEHRA